MFVLTDRNMLGFIGSGASSGPGYPSWDDMLQRAVEYVLLVAQ